MSQNTSTAVMARRKEPADSLDYFPTPPWATRALCWQLGGEKQLGHLTAWEPSCGEGHMAQPLAETFARVYRSDVYDHSATYDGQEWVHDFLMPYLPACIEAQGVDWIITNPPFRLAAEFVHRAVGIARQGVAMLVRTAFLEGIDRHANLFSVHRPWAVLQFTERVPMVKGKVDPEASSATAYCWIVWRTDIQVRDTGLIWIPPCRRTLERPEDYPEPEVNWDAIGGLFGGAR